MAVVINEIHYDPDVPTEQVEFLELHNTGAADVDLSGWRFDEAVDYTFPGGSSIPAGGFRVITQNAADFQTKYGFAPLGQWETGDRLSNDGETIELRDAANVLVDTVTYKLGFPWPMTGDYGSSLELINPALDNDLGGSWRSSGLSANPNAGATLVAPGSTWRYRKGIMANPPTAAGNAAPQMRQLTQSVQQPVAGQDVTISIKATDPDGVQFVVLDYQLVNPGAYIRITDPAYETSWTPLAMHDDGLSGDALAGDGVYSVTLPGSLQTNRRLVRYRITATDALGASIRGPYADDPQPNFAYYVYNGVPNYTASLQPGVQPNVVYDGAKLDDLATYQLIASATDVQNSQYNGQFNEVLFNGTLVYDGVVYDHLEFRNRGQASTYAVGKNKWKIEFLRGHYFQARDNYGNPYAELWDEINILPGTNPWWRNDVSTEGTVLFEPAAFKLYELAGTPSPRTHYFQFRVVDAASEAGANQYGGDFWGLDIGIEQPDGSSGHFDDSTLDDLRAFSANYAAADDAYSDIPPDIVAWHETHTR